jgi:anti-sigma factor ChrR (cupin superfamily)
VINVKNPWHGGSTVIEIIYNTEEMEWQPAKNYPSGAQVKVLRQGDASQGRTILLKLPPNWQMSAHSHTTIEQHFVLEGEYESQGKVFGAGNYRFIPRETSHGPFSTKIGAVILVLWDVVGS